LGAHPSRRPAARDPIRLIDGCLRDSEGHSTHWKFNAAWVPYPGLSAVLGATIRRSLERKLLIFLRLGFFFEPEGQGFATKLRFLAQASKARPRIPLGTPILTAAVRGFYK
jgi:hypothetical protein